MPILRTLCALMLLLTLAACATREQPFVLHVGGPEETSRHWSPTHAYTSHVQTFTACAKEKRAVTSFYLPSEGDFYIFGYRTGEEQGPAPVKVHHVSFPASPARQEPSADDAAIRDLGGAIIAVFYPVFVVAVIAAAIAAAPVMIAIAVNRQIHKPRTPQSVADCHTWVEDAAGNAVRGQPPFLGVGDS